MAIGKSRIFICYRREDSQGEAGRIDDALRHRYGAGRVFRDVYSPVGTDFPDHLARTVADSGVVVVVIGPRWLETLVSRLSSPRDWLRMEVRTALASPRTTVIPVLVQGAAMPLPERLPDDVRAISTIMAHELSDGRWEYDMSRLMAVLDRLVPPASRSRATSAAWLAGIVLACCAGIGLVPAVIATRAELPPGLVLASLAGAVLSTTGAAMACVNLLLRQVPRLRALALALLTVGMMLMSLGAGAVLRPVSDRPPDGPPPGWPPPDHDHPGGPPPGGRPPGERPPGSPPPGGSPPGSSHDLRAVLNGDGYRLSSA